MNSHSTQRRGRGTDKGFSLVEVLVYIAVMVLVSVTGVLTYLSLDTMLVRNATERAVSHAAQVALERISREIRSASSVNAAQSSFGASPSVLTLNAGATTTKFAVVADALVLTVNGTEIGPLTGENVAVEDFMVNFYSGTTTDMVRVALTVSAETKAASTTRTYYTSAVLRGSYD